MLQSKIYMIADCKFILVEKFFRICDSLRKRNELPKPNHADLDLCSKCPINNCTALEFYGAKVEESDMSKLKEDLITDITERLKRCNIEQLLGIYLLSVGDIGDYVERYVEHCKEVFQKREGLKLPTVSSEETVDKLKENPELKYKCDLCPKSFKTEKALKMHKRVSKYH